MDITDKIAEYMVLKFEEILNLFKRKNRDYQNTWAKRGGKGVLVRIEDKLTRIGNLLGLSKDQISVKDESLHDTIDDIIVYLFFLKLCLKLGLEFEIPEENMSALKNWADNS